MRTDVLCAIVRDGCAIARAPSNPVQLTAVGRVSGWRRIVSACARLVLAGMDVARARRSGPPGDCRTRRADVRPRIVEGGPRT